MSDQEQAIFISYAWKGESEEIVNQIDRANRYRKKKSIIDFHGISPFKLEVTRFSKSQFPSQPAVLLLAGK